MNVKDIFLKEINSHGVIEILSITAYSDTCMDTESVEQIELMVFETNLGLFYLNVDIDTDELFWSKDKPKMDDFIPVEIEIPLSINRFTVFMYWTMINDQGYYDAIQFQVKVASEDYIHYLHIQFVAVASTIKCYEFGIYSSLKELKK